MRSIDNINKNIEGRSKERRRARRERTRHRRRDRRASVSDVLGMTPTRKGNEDMATATALQLAQAAVRHRHDERPRHVSSMS